MESKPPTVTILSTADFDNPIWTNKQHLGSGLALSLPVNYIDSLGLRAPTLTVADLRRIMSKLMIGQHKSRRASPRATAGVEPRPTIISPRVVPFHGARIVRGVNQRLLTKLVLDSIPESDRDILWTFSPLTYGLERHFRRSVYHSVDLLHTFPGVPSAIILSAEKKLLQSADVAIASSSGVAQHLNTQGRSEVLLWENVADTALYRRNASDTPLRRAIFSGNLTPTKIDFNLLSSVAEAGVELALAGPVSIDGTGGQKDLDRLLTHPNVRYLGLLEPEELAREVGNAQVGLIPYKVNEHTNGIFPMKVFEYLASGLTVISTPLASLKERPPITGLTITSPDDYASAVRHEIGHFNLEQALARRDAAEPFSWENRLNEAREVVRSLASTTA